MKRRAVTIGHDFVFRLTFRHFHRKIVGWGGWLHMGLRTFHRIEAYGPTCSIQSCCGHRTWSGSEGFHLLHIFIDADACPVKKEVYRVARRYHLQVTLVANAWMRIPEKRWVRLEVVEDGLDAADDWIVEHVNLDDIVVTADIPLADRCLKKGAYVIGTNGKPFTENNIGSALATRDLLTALRGAGEITGGPPPLTKRDRSRFLQKLDDIIQFIRRQNPVTSA